MITEIFKKMHKDVFNICSVDEQPTLKAFKNASHLQRTHASVKK